MTGARGDRKSLPLNPERVILEGMRVCCRSPIVSALAALKGNVTAILTRLPSSAALSTLPLRCTSYRGPRTGQPIGPELVGRIFPTRSLSLPDRRASSWLRRTAGSLRDRRFASFRPSMPGQSAGFSVCLRVRVLRLFAIPTACIRTREGLRQFFVSRAVRPVFTITRRTALYPPLPCGPGVQYTEHPETNDPFCTDLSPPATR